MSAGSTDQKVSKRLRKNRRASRGITSVVLAFLRFLLSVPLKVAGALVRLFRASPRRAVLVFAPLLLLFGLFAVRSTLRSFHERLLPTSVVVHVANSDLALQVHDIVIAQIAESQRRQEPREVFLNNLAHALHGVDALDEVWLRLGLDKQLQITATEQIPVVVIETGLGDRYVVSNKLKVIAKGTENVSPKLLKITFPDVKKHAFPEVLNIPWFVRETQKLQDILATTHLTLAIEKVLWRSVSGYVLILKGPALAGASHVTVFLGEGNLGKKIAKLADILADVAARHVTIESIDLNYQDKAIIKAADSSNTHYLQGELPRGQKL